MHTASQSGLPVMRPMLMLEPHSQDALQANHQFMFGDCLLVAPIVTANTSKRVVYLPEGQWLEFFGLRAGKILESGQHIADAPLEMVPTYLRAGWALPVTQSAKHTTSANWQHLTWHLLPSGEMQGNLFEDAGDGYGEFRSNQISGTMDAQRLRLKKSTTGDLGCIREQETVVLYNILRVTNIVGAKESFYDASRQILTLHLEPTWTQFEVHF
jgi:alpha-glucosidase